MLKNILNTLSNNKKNIFYFILFFVAFLGFFDLVSAYTTDLSPSETRFNEMRHTASVIIEFFIKIVTVFLALITFLAVLFLSPEWYNGSIFGLNQYFKDIWIIVSNFVYFSFAFILIWIAFMNIIGKGQDKYALKQALPKFIVGIFIVPFSWFLVQFTLSVVSILSIAALNFPFDTFKSYEEKISSITLPVNCTLNLSDLKNLDESNTNDTSNEPKKYFDCADDEKQIRDFLASSNFTDSIFGVIGTYTYGILDLKSVSEIKSSDITSIKTIGDLAVKVLFDLIFIVIYSVLMIALGLVLLTRGIYLWIYIMISPVFGLMYFFGKTEGGSGFFEKFNAKEFLSLAMVPVYTMLALSLGLLFLFIIGNGLPSDENNYQSNFFKITQEGSNLENTVLSVGDNGAKLTIEGGLESSFTPNSFLADIGNGGLGIVGTLIMKIFGIVVLRMAVMAALSSSKITREIIKPLKDFGDQVGSLASKAPQYAPIFGGQSMKSLEQVGQKAQGYMNTRTTDRSNELWQKFGLENDYNTNMQRNIDSVKTAQSGEQISLAIDKALKSMEGNEVRLQSPEFKRLLDGIASNQREFINEDFRTYMNDLKGKDTLSNFEIEEAFKKLENEQVNISVNGGAISGAGISAAAIVDYVKSNGSKISQNEQQNNGGNNQEQQPQNNNIISHLTNTENPSLEIGNQRIYFQMSGSQIDSGNFTESNYKDIARAVLADRNVREQYDNFTEALKGEINKYIKDGKFVDDGGNGELDKSDNE